MHTIHTRLSLTALALALALFFAALPTALLAQDAPVTTETLVFESEVLASASSPGRQITLTLSPDGTATMSTDFMDDEDPVVEIGTWTSSEADQTLTLTLTGTAQGDYVEPVEIVFDVTAAGITAVEYDEAIYGSEGLSLALAQGTDADAEEPAGPEGIYQSDLLPAADLPGRIVTLELAAGAAVTMTTDFQNDEDAVVYTGDWAYDEAANEVAVQLTGGPNLVFEAPIDIVFLIEDDGSLVAAEYDLSLFGSEGLTLFPVEDLGSAEGVYVSDILPAADTPGQVVFMILYPNNAIQASTYYLNGEPPIQELGTWADNEDGSVTVVVTGSIESAYDVPQELVFERDGDTLTYLSLTLKRLPEAQFGQSADPLAWYQTEVMPAASTPGLQKSLIFFDDNTVQMISDYMNDEDPVIELGDWLENADGTLTVTLTGRPDRSYDEPDVLVFALDGDTLTAVEYSEELYGSQGLTFTEQPLNDLELAGDAGAVQGSAVTAGAPVTVTATVTGAGAVTDTETTDTETTTATADLPPLPPFEVPFGAVAVYTSDVLPAASSPGRVIRLVLFDDGSLQLITDYLNGENAVLELGAFTANGDGTLSVEVLGQIDGLYEAPIRFTFAETDAGLIATEWDETTYGREPLELFTEFQAE